MDARGTGFEDEPPSSSFRDGGWGRPGWMDRRGRDRGRKAGGGGGGGGVIQEESATVGLIRDQSFVSGLIFSSEVVSWPSLCSLRRSVRRSVAATPANSPIYSGLGHFN